MPRVIVNGILCECTDAAASRLRTTAFMDVAPRKRPIAVKRAVVTSTRTLPVKPQDDAKAALARLPQPVRDKLAAILAPAPGLFTREGREAQNALLRAENERNRAKWAKERA